MWYSPSVFVPIYVQPSALIFADGPTTGISSVRPMTQRFSANDLVGCPEHRLSIEDERKIFLSKSVYDLVKTSHFLELSDPKLLGWFLSLPLEDRKLIQDEGGITQFLRRHPALEVLKQVVYLKRHNVGNDHHPFPAFTMSTKIDGSRQAAMCGVSQCVNCGTSSFGAEMCRPCSTLILNREENVCISEEENSLWLLPNNVRAELNLLNCQGHVGEDVAAKSPQQSDCMSRTAANLSATPCVLSNGFQEPRDKSSDGQMWNVKEVQLSNDPVVQASSLRDQELELQSHHQSSAHDPVPLLPYIHSNAPNPEKETLPEYYSLNSAPAECEFAQCSDAANASMIATKDRTEASTALTWDAERCTSFDSVSFHSSSSNWTDLTEDSQNLNSDDETGADAYHSMHEEASSLTVSVPCINTGWSASDQSTHKSEFECEGCISSTSLTKLNVKHATMCAGSSASISASQTVGASGDFPASFTSNRATEITQDFVVKHCQDVSTGMDLCSVNQETQTIPRLTSEKCTITEVYTSDMDALCEEFGNFKMTEQELIDLKDERSGPGGAGEPRNEQQQSHCGCGALPRARRAELRLLALQFAMCQQHCWRRFYTSPQGETSLHRIDAVPDVLSPTLKHLEDQYLEMKTMIMEGDPLDNLKPLSVDTKGIKAATFYRPSLIYEAFLGDRLPASSYNSSGLHDEGQSNPADKVLKRNVTDCGHLNQNAAASWHDSATPSKTVSSQQIMSVLGSSQQPGVSNDAEPGAPKDCREAWFDAEEELECDYQSCKVGKETRQKAQGDSEKNQNVDANRKDQRALICASNLPNDVTEHDVWGCTSQTKASQVSLSKCSNTRVATVTVRNPNDAEAAVSETNGQSIQGHTLHVEHIHTPPADGQVTIKESCVPLSPAAHKAGSAGEVLIPQSVNICHASEPLHCCLDKLTNICTTPTATGTCVPQRYGTMESFDMIMAQLLERHRNVGRQQIVGALLKLQTKPHGVLSGLPIRDIVAMTSDLLLHSVTD